MQINLNINLKNPYIMKKALVLGIMAFFAINMFSIQNVNAQNKPVKAPSTAPANDKTTLQSQHAVAQPGTAVNANTATEAPAVVNDNPANSKTTLKGQRVPGANASTAVQADRKKEANAINNERRRSRFGTSTAGSKIGLPPRTLKPAESATTNTGTADDK